jgi:HK97 family phage major capsid protein
MSEFIRSQQEVRNNLIMQVRSIIDVAETEARGLTAEDSQKIDRIEADIRAADMAIEVATRNEERKLEATVAAGSFVPAAEVRSDAELFRAMARGEVRGHEFPAEFRATLVPSANTVPVSFYDQVFGVARQVGPILNVADVITRSSGNDLRIPIYTAFSTAGSVAAGSAISESNPTFDSLLLQPTKTGFIVPVANELLADAGFDIASVIAEQAGNAIGTYINNTATTTLIGAAGSGVASGSATLQADALIDLAYSVDGAVRTAGAGYMAATSTLGAIRKLKDTAGNYLYQVGVGQPDTFAGFAVYENPGMSAVGSGVKSVLFGDYKALKLVSTGLDVATSSDAYFAQDVTGYRFTYRFASGLTHAAKVKYLTTA